MKKIITWISFAAVLVGIFMISPQAYAKKVQKKITVTSAAFANNGAIPAKYGAIPEVPGGENISIPLQWTIKKKTAKKIKSFAISMVDHHPVANNCVHFLVINIPADTRELAEGALNGYASVPIGTQQLLNCIGELGYFGPAPPQGSGDHTYEITIYGLSVPEVPGITMDNAMDKQYSEAEFKALIKGKVVAKARLKGKLGL